MNWSFKIDILSTNTVERFEPLTNNCYECIVKFISNNDDDGLEQYLGQLVESLNVSQNVKWNKLNIIDKMYILTDIRGICIFPNIKLVVTDKEKGKMSYTVDLGEIERSIESNYIPSIVCKDKEYNTEIILHYPHEWDNKNELISYISEVTVDDITIPGNEISTDDISKIIDRLSPHIYGKLNKAKDTLEKSISKMKFVNVSSKIVSFKVDELLHYIKLLFSDTLTNVVELNYVLVKLANISMESIMKLTPIDAQLYYKMFLKEQAQRNKKQQKADGKGVSFS